VRVVFPEILPELAVMVVVPAAIAVARPLLLIVATDGFDELQVTCEVRSFVVPSENVPVAANGWVAPILILGTGGERDMEDRVADFTVRVVLPEILPELAVTVVVPAAAAVARPLLLTGATDGFDELQVTWEVISWVDASENVPVAANCWVACRGMLGSAGVIDMEDRVPEVTVRVVLPKVPPNLAVMVVVPAARAVARPLLVTVATAELDESQVTSEVIL